MGSQTLLRGPLIVAGSVLNQTGELISPYDGPSTTFQGNGFIDPRFPPIMKDTISPGSVPSFYMAPFVVSYDSIPQANNTQAIATGQACTSGAALGLVTAVVASALVDNGTFWTYGIPIIPQGTSSVVIVGAIDFGFATGTTTANSTTVVVSDSINFSQGQWICVGGAGNTTGSTALFAQVASVANATTIFLSVAAATALTRAPIGNTNFNNTLVPPGTPSGLGPQPTGPTAASIYDGAGFASFIDGRYAGGRTVSVVNYTTVLGTSPVLISGFDSYGYAMTELITGNGSTAWGKKAFKFIRSATPQGTGTTVSIGLGDAFGFMLRADAFSQIDVASQTAVATLTNGFTTASLTNPATNTSGDVRGTVQISPAGPIGTSAIGVTTNGTSRLTIAQYATQRSMVLSFPGNFSALFGVTQA